MASRIGQNSFYVQDDIKENFEQFVRLYPMVRITDLANAALREYLPLALKEGVDGNLTPLCKGKKKGEK